MTTGILTSASFSLLLGCFGISVLSSLRQGSGLTASFEKLAFGYILIVFHAPALEVLQTLGKELETLLHSKESLSELDKFVGATLLDAATKAPPGTPEGMLTNLLSYASQIVRTGVWGVLASCTELLYLLARFILEVGRDALWQVLVVLFPLAAAAVPTTARILLGMAIFALELALWLPMLAVINIACSEVARRYMQIPGDIGFYVLALEIVAVSLTLAVPMIAHKFITGSLSGSVLEPWKASALKGSLIFKMLQAKSLMSIMPRKRR